GASGNPPIVDLSILMGEAQGDTVFVRIAGMADPNQSVDVLVDDVSIGRVQADAQGDWFYITRMGRPGNYLLRARTLDGLLSEPLRFAVDELPVDAIVEAAPIVEEAVPADTVEMPPTESLDIPRVDALLGDTPIEPGFVMLGGQAEPNAQLDVLLNDVVIGSAVAAEDGRWTYLTRLLEPGDYQVSAATSRGKADPVVITIDAPVVAAEPIVEEPIVEEPVVDATTTLTETAMVDVSPSVTVTPAITLTPSAITATALVTTPEVITPEVTAPEIVAAEGVTTEVATSDAVTMTVPLDTDAADEVTEMADAVTVPTIDPALGDAPYPAGFVMLRGAAQPGEELDILVAGITVGRTQVQDDGTWSLLTRMTNPGVYDVIARQEDGTNSPAQPVRIAAVEATATAPITVTVPLTESLVVTATAPSEVAVFTDSRTLTATTALTTPLTMPVVEADDVTTPEPLLRAPSIDLDALSGELPVGFVTVSGEGEPNSQVEIIVDDAVIGRTAVNSEGRWSFMGRLSEPGLYSVGAATVDGAATEAIPVRIVDLLTATPQPTATDTATPEPTSTE
ncbi:MAG: hypothetical protein KDD78_20780, partial [Caldilineaceae bacterium]|nr:hypothetical protein [Caldilineaceae bacterium]